MKKSTIYLLLLGSAMLIVINTHTTEASPGTGTSTRELKSHDYITDLQPLQLPVVHLEYGVAISSVNVRFTAVTYWTNYRYKTTAGRKASYYYLMGRTSKHSIPYGMRS